MKNTFVALLQLASLILSTSAQSLSFVRPAFDDLDTNADGQPRLDSGRDVTIEWESEFEYTSLVVYQAVEEKVYLAQALAGTHIQCLTLIYMLVGQS